MVADFINFLSQAGTITIILGYVFTLWVVLTLWTWFDIGSRTTNVFYRIGSVVLVALGFLLGFVIYLIMRPSQTRNELQMRLLEEKVFESQSRSSFCYNCSEVVEPEFLYCANCGTHLRKNCEGCDREISYIWNICPYCAHRQKEKIKEVIEDFETPATAGSVRPNIRILAFIKDLRLPKISLARGGRKRGRPRKEKVEVAPKRPRGRPRKEIATAPREA